MDHQRRHLWRRDTEARLYFGGDGRHGQPVREQRHRHLRPLFPDAQSLDHFERWQRPHLCLRIEVRDREAGLDTEHVETGLRLGKLSIDGAMKGGLRGGLRVGTTALQHMVVREKYAQKNKTKQKKNKNKKQKKSVCFSVAVTKKTKGARYSLALVNMAGHVIEG